MSRVFVVITLMLREISDDAIKNFSNGNSLFDFKHKRPASD